MELFFYITIMVGLSVVLLIALFFYQAYLKKLEHETAREELKLQVKKTELAIIEKTDDRAE